MYIHTCMYYISSIRRESTPARAWLIWKHAVDEFPSWIDGRVPPSQGPLESVGLWGDETRCLESLDGGNGPNYRGNRLRWTPPLSGNLHRQHMQSAVPKRPSTEGINKAPLYAVSVCFMPGVPTASSANGRGAWRYPTTNQTRLGDARPRHDTRQLQHGGHSIAQTARAARTRWSMGAPMQSRGSSENLVRLGPRPLSPCLPVSPS